MPHPKESTPVRVGDLTEPSSPYREHPLWVVIGEKEVKIKVLEKKVQELEMEVHLAKDGTRWATLQKDRAETQVTELQQALDSDRHRTERKLAMMFRGMTELVWFTSSVLLLWSYFHRAELLEALVGSTLLLFFLLYQHQRIRALQA